MSFKNIVKKMTLNKDAAWVLRVIKQPGYALTRPDADVSTARPITDWDAISRDAAAHNIETYAVSKDAVYVPFAKAHDDLAVCTVSVSYVEDDTPFALHGLKVDISEYAKTAPPADVQALLDTPDDQEVLYKLHDFLGDENPNLLCERNIEITAVRVDAPETVLRLLNARESAMEMSSPHGAGF